jgi:hypothetical protein
MAVCEVTFPVMLTHQEAVTTHGVIRAGSPEGCLQQEVRGETGTTGVLTSGTPV